MYRVKPKNYMHGKKLKIWYRRLNLAKGLGYFNNLPQNWADKPSVKVTAVELTLFIKALEARSNSISSLQESRNGQ